MKRLSLLTHTLIIIIFISSVCMAQAMMRVEIKDGKIVKTEQLVHDEKNKTPQIQTTKTKELTSEFYSKPAIPLTVASNQKSSTPLDGVDLSIANIALAKLIGSNLSFSYQIMISSSQAFSYAPGSIPVKYYLSTDNVFNADDYLVGMYVNPGTISSAANWVSGEISLNGLGIPEGTYVFAIIIDPTNMIAETNEENNYGFYTSFFTVASGDFDVTISGSPISTSWTNIEVDWSIINSGSSAIPYYLLRLETYLSSDYNIETSDYRISSVDWPSPLPAGQTMHYVVSVNLNAANAPVVPDGRYYLGGIIDPLNIIPEVNETNNAHLINGVNVTVGGGVDLSFTGTATSTGWPNILIDFTVRNQSNVDITTPFNLGFYLTNVDPSVIAHHRIIRIPISQLGANQTAQTQGLVIDATNMPADIPDGEYKLWAFVDDTGVIQESNENDNQFELPNFRIRKGATINNFDLSIANVQITDAVGSDISFSFQINNAGTSGTLNGNNLGFPAYYLSLDQTISNSDFQLDATGTQIPSSDLIPGGNLQYIGNVQVTNVPDNLYYLGIVVDPNNIIPESNESNNMTFAAATKVKIGNPSAIEDQYGIPNEFKLSQNYPNPFNPSTRINYSIPSVGYVSLKIFDVTGCEIATLVDEEKSIGYYSIDFDATKFSSGVYFGILKYNTLIKSIKLILTK